MVENSYPMVDNLENLQMASVKIVIQSFSVGIVWIIEISRWFPFVFKLAIFYLYCGIMFILKF